MRCELQWSGEVVKGSGVKRVGCKEGGERGSSTSVENTEYEKHVQLRSRYDFAGLHKLIYIITHLAVCNF